MSLHYLPYFALESRGQIMSLSFKRHSALNYGIYENSGSIGLITEAIAPRRVRIEQHFTIP